MNFRIVPNRKLIPSVAHDNGTARDVVDLARYPTRTKMFVISMRMRSDCAWSCNIAQVSLINALICGEFYFWHGNCWLFLDKSSID
ncbi:MAG: hypothetical protein WB870_16100 [Gallionellaceae bacterium]